MLHCNNRSEFKNTWKGTGSVTGNCRLDGTPPETLLPVLRKEFSWENETKPCGPRFVSKCLTLKGVVDLCFLVGLGAVAPGATSPGFSRWKTCTHVFRCCKDDVVLTAGGRFLQPLDMEYCPIIGVLVQVIILMTSLVASSPPMSKSL